jgi:DNA gyrase subunit A
VSVTDDSDEVMLISDKGTLVRTTVEEVRTMGRNTQGVRLIKLIKGENLVGLQNVIEIDSDEDEEGADDTTEADTNVDAPPVTTAETDSDGADEAIDNDE